MKLAAALLFILPASVALAQSDAEKFAEGRIALDKHNDCRAAKLALESVSDKGKSEPLWLFYAAKTYECLNQPETALRLYEKYNQLMPGQAAIIDKIGELRYQVGQKQREKEADLARQQKLEEDRQEHERKRQSALSVLPDLLRALQADTALNTSWTNGREMPSNSTIKAVGAPSCEFGFTLTSEDPDDRSAPNTKFETVLVQRLTKNIVLDLTKVVKVDRSKTGDPPFLNFSSGSVYTDIISGTEEKVDKLVAIGQKASGWDYSSDHLISGWYFRLFLAPSITEADVTRLKQSFEHAIQACHDAM